MFTANSKHEIHVFVSRKNEYIDENSAILIILTFDTNAKLLDNFTEKRKTASGKCRINVVMWSFLPFTVSVILTLSIVGSTFYMFSQHSANPIDF